ncbi:conserved hypothetical protein [Vibrio phage 501E54-1]|nr:conserved hypothetical protein [Vibrio phage 501E54-1]
MTTSNKTQNTVKFSAIKLLKTFCEGLHSEPCFREVLGCILNEETDFEVNNVRFISDETILSVMVDEIFGDDYILGCFNASFIAENSDIPLEMIAACQEAEAHEAIGKGLNATMDQDEKESFCEEYASADGYGHHFNGYDFSEEEFNFNGVEFHVFDNQ